MNFPGSWADSDISQRLAVKCVEKLNGYQVCVDQGFKRSGDLHEVFVGPLSKKAKSNLSPILKDLLISKHEIYVSLRQASEWGMRALQGSFARLKAKLTWDREKRGNILFSIVLLHNFRTHKVGINQIAAVFNPEYDQYINIVDYDSIARYF